MNGKVYISKAQDVVSNVLAKGSAIRQDAMNKAKAFDEKHQLRATASARVISFDRRVGLTEKLTVGISVVNEKVKSVDQRLQVSDKTMAAVMAAERKLNDTGSAVKSSRSGFFKNVYVIQLCFLTLQVFLYLLLQLVPRISRLLPALFYLFVRFHLLRESCMLLRLKWLYELNYPIP